MPAEGGSRGDEGRIVDAAGAGFEPTPFVRGCEVLPLPLSLLHGRRGGVAVDAVRGGVGPGGVRARAVERRAQERRRAHASRCNKGAWTRCRGRAVSPHLRRGAPSVLFKRPWCVRRGVVGRPIRVWEGKRREMVGFLCGLLARRLPAQSPRCQTRLLSQKVLAPSSGLREMSFGLSDGCMA